MCPFSLRSKKGWKENSTNTWQVREMNKASRQNKTLPAANEGANTAPENYRHTGMTVHGNQKSRSVCEIIQILNVGKLASNFTIFLFVTARSLWVPTLQPSGLGVSRDLRVVTFSGSAQVVVTTIQPCSSLGSTDPAMFLPWQPRLERDCCISCGQRWLFMPSHPIISNPPLSPASGPDLPYK